MRTIASPCCDVNSRARSVRRAGGATRDAPRPHRRPTIAKSPRLFVNVGANLAGGLLNGVLTLAGTPLLAARMGLSAFGLVGFWLLLQSLVQLLDLGMGSTLVHGLADPDPGVDAERRRRNLVRTLEAVYWAIALVTLALTLAASGWLATDWLDVRRVPAADATASLRWMALAVSLQLPGVLYSSGLLGLQKQVRVNVLQVCTTALRYGGGLAVLALDPAPPTFFAFQAAVSVAQTLVARLMLSVALGNAPGITPRFDRAILRRVWRFSAGMAVTAAGGALIANVDRIVLSRLRPADDLGRYTLAFTAAAVLQLGIQPFYRAYFPRFAELVAAGRTDDLRATYLQGCRLVGAIIVPAAILGWVFAPELLGAWLGHADPVVVRTFRWLLVGVGSAGLGWLPAALQQAHGWTRLHAGMVFGAVIAGAPLLFWTIPRFGPPGAAAAWILHGLSDLTLGLYLMKRRLFQRHLVTWYLWVLLPPLVVAGAVALALRAALPLGGSRLVVLAALGVAGALATGASGALALLRPVPHPRGHAA